MKDSKSGRYVAVIRLKGAPSVKFCVDGFSKANARINLSKDPEFLKWLASVREDTIEEVVVSASAVRLKHGWISGRVLLATD
jgi:hypothetical protein